ncbi:copper resistance system multicopper oxidase [Lysobacter sp. N42]|jgi:CopA family copper-resistance protein|uniref:copper resistance system multicopper oxidase n=1 Tax=Lysobacter sp. N42 TaxID=2545719 RepID=UPI00104F60DD|nr:copper resistance system multicopper oxidase [Lysobacter sp. N42]TCZ84328.1 copper resistance system multicopper oxidase [Lysobacter sp. N42]
MSSRFSRAPHPGVALPSRRRFVQGLAAGGAVAALGLPSLAQPRRGDAPVLRGTDFDLVIGETPVNFTGRVRPAVTVNGSLPAPTLRWKEGTTVELRVRNALPRGSIHGDQASIHWHGILLPANMDGVPGISFDGIARGETYRYRFDVVQSGTYWYHSHSAFQEQAGLYGALIVDPAGSEPFAYDREHVVLLSDWTDLDPARLFARLKKMSDHDNLYKRTVADFMRDAQRHGLAATLADRKMWGQMRMTPTDLSDVNANTYTYLMNGTTTPGNWTGLFRTGEKVRLRFINGSAMTYFDVRIPGLKMTVVAADGLPVHPVTVDEFRIATAETFDVIVEPSGQDAFAIFAQDSGRTGYVSGTLAVREGLRAPVPPLDPRPILTMRDMAMDHGAHGGHGAMEHVPASGSNAHAGHDMAPADHAAHGDIGSAGMDHAGMGHGTQAAAADPHARHATAGAAHGAPAAMQAHPASERGNPLVESQAMTPASRLDDPGNGMGTDGRKALSYSMLRSLFADPDGREPGRTLEMHLTGHMEKFAWSFDGIKHSGSGPIRLKYGERMRITLVNDTMMSHPIHLHGMWSDLEDDEGNFQVRKHTIDMPPGSKRSYRVRADALGRWAFHCHLLYHMESGMMRDVEVHE